MSTPRTWPKYLTVADYARACTEATNQPVTRQAIANRIRKKTLPTEALTIGDKTRTYINTETNPPGPAAGRWPDRPAGSVKLPRRPKPAAS